jgi:hypothetical protein
LILTSESDEGEGGRSGRVKERNHSEGRSEGEEFVLACVFLFFFAESGFLYNFCLHCLLKIAQNFLYQKNKKSTIFEYLLMRCSFLKIDRLD